MSDNEISLMKKRLLQLVLDKSFQYSEEKTFKLTSGQYSHYYVDSKQTTLNPEGMNLIGNIIFEDLKNQDIDAVGGLTLGADPIAYAISMISFQKGAPILPFVVRKTQKEHGIKKSIEGAVKENDRVVILDDVITTGKSTLEAINKAREANLTIVKAIALIDREEGGRSNIEKEGISVKSLFSRTNLLGELKNRGVDVSSL